MQKITCPICPFCPKAKNDFLNNPLEGTEYHFQSYSNLSHRTNKNKHFVPQIIENKQAKNHLAQKGQKGQIGQVKLLRVRKDKNGPL